MRSAALMKVKITFVSMERNLASLQEKSHSVYVAFMEDNLVYFLNKKTKQLLSVTEVDVYD